MDPGPTCLPLPSTPAFAAQTGTVGLLGTQVPYGNSIARPHTKFSRRERQVEEGGPLHQKGVSLKSYSVQWWVRSIRYLFPGLREGLWASHSLFLQVTRPQGRDTHFLWRWPSSVIPSLQLFACPRAWSYRPKDKM